MPNSTFPKATGIHALAAMRPASDHFLKRNVARLSRSDVWTDMTTPFETNAATTQPRPKNAANAMLRRARSWKAKPSGFPRPLVSPQHAQRNYEHYLALARAEAQRGDRIAAENYFQHAEHYWRSMHEFLATTHSAESSRQGAKR
jgi:hypothetical protein